MKTMQTNTQFWFFIEIGGRMEPCATPNENLEIMPERKSKRALRKAKASD